MFDGLKRVLLGFFDRVTEATRVLLGISVQVDDQSPGWHEMIPGAGPADQNWSDRREVLTDALEAWRKNFFVRQIVRLMTAYVVSDGLLVSSRNETVEAFTRAFFAEPRNQEESVDSWCDELTRSGELFFALFTNSIDGMSYVRAIPAASVPVVDTNPEDFRDEWGYWVASSGAEDESAPKKESMMGHSYYKSIDNPSLRPGERVMLHFHVNRPVGATRGEGDLTPLLPWCARYVDWLKGRLAYNRMRTRMAAVDVEVPEKDVETKRKEYERNPPSEGAVYIHGPKEKLTMQAANIQGWDAQPDGRALRLAVATGANVGLHFFAEGDTANRATAVEMGSPTQRVYKNRQRKFSRMLERLVEAAYERKVALGLAEVVDNYEWSTKLPDIAVSDNRELAQAAWWISQALLVMRQLGWITDDRAVGLIYKFAGEIISEREIQEIIREADQMDPNDPEVLSKIVPPELKTVLDGVVADDVLGGD